MLAASLNTRSASFFSSTATCTAAAFKTSATAAGLLDPLLSSTVSSSNSSVSYAVSPVTSKFDCANKAPISIVKFNNLNEIRQGSLLHYQ